MHRLFGAAEASSRVLSKHIALLLGDIGLSAWEGPRHQCYCHKAQEGSLPIWKLVRNLTFGNSITQFLDLKIIFALWKDKREKVSPHFIAWKLLPGIACKPYQLHWCFPDSTRTVHCTALVSLSSSLQHAEGQWGYLLDNPHLWLEEVWGMGDPFLLRQTTLIFVLATCHYLTPVFRTCISSLWFSINMLFRWH